MTIERLNTISTLHTTSATFPPNRNRGYFFVVMLDAVGTIRFGKGTGEIPLGIGDHYAPTIAPTGEIVIGTAGSFVVHMG